MSGPTTNQAAVESRVALGRALQAVRLQLGLSTREVTGYSSAHISQVENGKVAPSEKLVRTYIEMGGEPGRLLGLLDRARAARSRPREPDGSADLRSPYSDPYLLRRGYTIERVSDTHRFGSSRRLLSISHQARVYRVDSDARYFPIRYSYEDDPRPGIATVVATAGCRVAVQEQDPLGTLYAVIDFADAVPDDSGAIEVTWSIRVRSDVPSRPRVTAGTSARLPLAMVAAEFVEGAVPDDVRPFRGFDPRIAASDKSLLPSDGSSSRYTQMFTDLETEWWGLHWTWPTS